jgi:nucleoside-diphosphate-sugar epimerase
MRVIILGATGMVGFGVLRESLLADDVTEVITVGRSATGQQHPKLQEIVHADLMDLTPIEDRLNEVDATFFCLGVSSAGMSEADYRRVTYDYTLSFAGAMERHSPGSTFVYVSGAGTDSTEQGRTMWARVKGATENAILRMNLDGYMFRPGFIQPVHGARSKTTVYRIIYAISTPVYPLLKRIFPRGLTTTEVLGRAMLAVARRRVGNGKAESDKVETRILGPIQINELGS